MTEYERLQSERLALMIAKLEGLIELMRQVGEVTEGQDLRIGVLERRVFKLEGMAHSMGVAWNE